MSKATCAVQTCLGEPYRRGWCTQHWQVWRATGDPLGNEDYAPRPAACTVDECDKPVVAKGLCSGHYIRMRKYGDPALSWSDLKPKQCSVEGCTGRPISKGLCNKHYQRMRLHGDPLAVPDKSVPNRHEIERGYGVLIITQRDGIERRAKYDLGDHTLIAAYTWYWSNGYIARNYGPRGRTRLELLHRRLLDLSVHDPRVGDHISGDRGDNRRSNLRIADSGLNGENRAVVNELGSSRYRGVCRDRGMWKAYARIDGVMHNIGRYPTEQEAADAVARYREEHGVNSGYPRRHPDSPSKSKRRSA